MSELLVLDISPFGVSDSISTLPRSVEMMRRISLPSELSLPQARTMVDTALLPLVKVKILLDTVCSVLLPSGTFIAEILN